MTVDRLTDYGVTRMDEAEIRNFLDNQRSGVLGLPDDGSPYLLPMSFGYDGESQLYFTYVMGPESRKRDLSDRAETARFLAYSVQSPFIWQSVLLTGGVEPVPEPEWGGIEEYLRDTWRPELFDSAGRGEDVAVYRFRIHGEKGLKHAGLPPGLADESTAEGD